MASLDDDNGTHPTTFHLFPQLPHELRLMIWKRTLPSPRVLEIKYHSGNHDDDGPILHGYFDAEECALPIRYQACRESHDVFTRQYTISFARMGAGPRIFFDPKRDVLVVARCTEANARLVPAVAGGLDPLVYYPWVGATDRPGGSATAEVDDVGVFGVIENLGFVSYDLGSALYFLRDLRTFEGYLGVKSIIVAVELEPVESDAVPMGNTERLGQPRLMELAADEEERASYELMVWGFRMAYAESFPDRVVPRVEVMAVQRHKTRGH